MSESPTSKRVCALEATLADVAARESAARRARLVAGLLVVVFAAAAAAVWLRRGAAEAPGPTAVERATRLAGDAPDAETLRAAWEALDASEAPRRVTRNERRRREQHLGRLIAATGVLDRSLAASRTPDAAVRDRRLALGEALGWLALVGGDRQLARVAFEALAEHGATPSAIEPLLAAVDRDASRPARRAARRTRALLDELDRGLRRPGRPAWEPGLDELIRDGCAAGPDGLGPAVERVARLTARARQGGRDATWSPTDRDVLRFCCALLARPGRVASVAPLAALLAVLWDRELVVVVGRALCDTRTGEAFAPLARMRERLGPNDPAWRGVVQSLHKIPEPLGAEERSVADLVRVSQDRLARGDAAGAVAAATRALALEPDDLAALIARGRARVRAGRTAAGIADLDRAVARHGADARAHGARGRAKRWAGDLDGALVDLNAAIERDRAPVWLIQRSLALSKLGRVDAALADATAALGAAKRNPMAHHAHGVALHAAERHEEAIEALSLAITLDGDDARHFFRRGGVHQSRRDWQRARTDYDAALARDPGAWMVYANRGICLFRLLQPRLALRDLDRALELEPGHVTSLSNRAAVRFTLGDLQGALGDYEATLARRPRHPQARAGLGRVKLALGDIVGAIAAYDSAIEVAPRDAQLYHWRARARHARGELGAAVADHAKAVELAPRSWELWAHYAQALSAADDRAGALKALRRAHELAPADRRAGLAKSIRQLEQQ